MSQKSHGKESGSGSTYSRYFIPPLLFLFKICAGKSIITHQSFRMHPVLFGLVFLHLLQNLYVHSRDGHVSNSSSASAINRESLNVVPVCSHGVESDSWLHLVNRYNVKGNGYNNKTR